MLGEVAVEAIDRQVELAVRVPADVEIVLVERPVAGLRREFVPGRAACAWSSQKRSGSESASSWSSASSVGPMRASKSVGTGCTASAMRSTPSPPVRERAGPARDADGRPSCRRPRARRRLGCASNAATISSAWRTSSPDGVKAALMTGTCAGWIASLPVKPSRRAASASALQALFVLEVGEHAVDRLDARRRRRRRGRASARAGR